MCKAYKSCVAPELRRWVFKELIDARTELRLVKVEENIKSILDEDRQQVLGLLARRKGVDGLSESSQLG